LAIYQLTFRADFGVEPMSMPIDAPDETSARAKAGGYIAQALGRPGQLVLLDPRGRFRIGAGFLTPGGSYSLELLDAPVSRVIAP